MTSTWISIIEEREYLNKPYDNIVSFGTDMELLHYHSQLVSAADIIQSRFFGTSFLVEGVVGDASAQRTLYAELDAFELTVGSGLYLVPFERRDALPDAVYSITNFHTYCGMFDILRGAVDADVDALWESLFAEEGFLTFRLILETP